MNKLVKAFTTATAAVLLAISLAGCGPSTTELALKQAQADLKASKAEVAKLKPLADQVPTLKAQADLVPGLKRDLGAEIDRKQKLAVENTQLKGRVAQGQVDIGIVANKKPNKVAANSKAVKDKKG